MTNTQHSQLTAQVQAIVELLKSIDTRLSTLERTTAPSDARPVTPDTKR